VAADGPALPLLGAIVTLRNGLGGACEYAEADWCCCKRAGHDGPHESAPLGEIASVYSEATGFDSTLRAALPGERP
jgi:hypothetical protein